MDIGFDPDSVVGRAVAPYMRIASTLNIDENEVARIAQPHIDRTATVSEAFANHPRFMSATDFAWIVAYVPDDRIDLMTSEGLAAFVKRERIRSIQG